jgi:hypothetical protein
VAHCAVGVGTWKEVFLAFICCFKGVKEDLDNLRLPCHHGRRLPHPQAHYQALLKMLGLHAMSHMQRLLIKATIAGKLRKGRGRIRRCREGRMEEMQTLEELFCICSFVAPRWCHVGIRSSHCMSRT